ncbi:hypothetical protein HID58_074871, partial [Brassica napus]
DLIGPSGLRDEPVRIISSWNDKNLGRRFLRYDMYKVCNYMKCVTLGRGNNHCSYFRWFNEDEKKKKLVNELTTKITNKELAKKHVENEYEMDSCYEHGWKSKLMNLLCTGSDDG